MKEQSIVAFWNEMMLDAIRTGGAKPTATTYQLYLTSTAVYDAWAAFDDAAYGQASEIETSLAATDANKAEAVSYASYRMLSEFFPDRQATFDAFMAELGLDPDVTTADPASAAGVGNLAAANVFAARAGDDSNYANDFADTTGYTPVNSPDPTAPNAPGGPDFDPNAWQPLRVPNGTLVDENGVPIFDNDDPSTYEDQEALTPQWGDVDPFALTSGDQFQPPAPPQLGDFSPYEDARGNVTTNDQAYRDQVAEVVEASAGLTTRKKQIAEYWADGPRTESPPGHWNQIAQDIALREGHGIDDDAKLFFALNAAVFDAGISAWEAKYEFNYVRPQSAIRNLYFEQEIEAWGGPNQGTQTILGQEWQPYQAVTFVTPPFPEFVSGHSIFSMAAAKTIASFVGSDQFYDGQTLGNYDLDDVPGTDLLGRYVATELAFEDFPESEDPVVLQWATLTEAAQEAGISRIYGGIHIRDGNERGLAMGKEVAENAEIRWEALFTRGGDDRLTADRDGGLLIAGAGDDIVRGHKGDDTVEGGPGDDDIRGHMGDDILLGEEGDDRLFGHDGNDIIAGGDGYDTIKGGKGADTIVFFAGETGHDYLKDFDPEEDMLVLSGFSEGAVLEVIDEAREHLMLRVDGDDIAAIMRGAPDDIVLGENIVFDDPELGYA